ncbi:TetR/AcrR family transcriptional regulator [Faunimonas sp. B44]|uniref:TetR/AcrR family transcriptional regulator n=1 Tax=Faunimonas sp. B44 TaxID=3461493 RepID=UPI004044BECF
MSEIGQSGTGQTRERLLQAAERAVLAKGFAATSIEELIAEVGITKSGFFYHFRDKGALAKALLLRYLEQDRELLEDIFRRGDELNDDPLHGFLVGLKLFAEMLADMKEAHPGCLAASFCYQDQLFNREIRELNAQGVLAWRRRFQERLELIATIYPPRPNADLEALADMAAVLVEGGLILGRMLSDPTIVPRQIQLYRELVRSTFQPGEIALELVAMRQMPAASPAV